MRIRKTYLILELLLMPLIIWTIIILILGNVFNPSKGELLGLLIMYICGIPLTILMLVIMVKKI